MKPLTRLAFLGLALVDSIATTACGDGGNPTNATQSTSPSAATPSASMPTTAPSSPSVSPTPTGPPRLKVGDTFVGRRSKITIRSAKVGGPSDMEPGTVWLYSDVRICNTGKDAMNTPSWASWLLKTRDGYEMEPADITPEPRQPALPYEREIAPNDCVRGWLTFAPPKGSPMAEIRLVEDLVFETGSVIVSWRAR